MNVKKSHNTAWVVVKSVKVRDSMEKDSPLVAILSFMQQVNVVERTHQGKVRIICYRYGRAEKGEAKYYTGYIPESAITYTEIIDYASLFYINRTGRPVPVSTGYCKANVIGYVKPGEVVKMIARCGDWCLTNKGWTKYRWFRKRIGDFSDSEISALANNIILQAVKDYELAIKKLRGGFQTRDEFMDSIGRVDEVTSWFCSPKSDYCLFFETGTGQEKLDALNKHLRVEKKWLDEKHRVMKEIQERSRRYRR